LSAWLGNLGQDQVVDFQTLSRCLFKFRFLTDLRIAADSNRGKFATAESFRVPKNSISARFLWAESKGVTSIISEVEHLVPNQIPDRIEAY
jgi:hypothetical protein